MPREQSQDQNHPSVHDQPSAQHRVRPNHNRRFRYKPKFIKQLTRQLNPSNIPHIPNIPNIPHIPNILDIAPNYTHQNINQFITTQHHFHYQNHNAQHMSDTTDKHTPNKKFPNKNSKEPKAYSRRSFFNRNNKQMYRSNNPQKQNNFHIKTHIHHDTQSVNSNHNSVSYEVPIFKHHQKPRTLHTTQHTTHTTSEQIPHVSRIPIKFTNASSNTINELFAQEDITSVVSNIVCCGSAPLLYAYSQPFIHDTRLPSKLVYRWTNPNVDEIIVRKITLWICEWGTDTRTRLAESCCSRIMQNVQIDLPDTTIKPSQYLMLQVDQEHAQGSSWLVVECPV